MKAHAKKDPVRRHAIDWPRKLSISTFPESVNAALGSTSSQVRFAPRTIPGRKNRVVRAHLHNPYWSRIHTHVASISIMKHVEFAGRGITNSARAVFDLGKERLKSEQSEATLLIRFAVQDLRIQFVGRCARMARELPEINGAARSGKWWGVRNDRSELLSTECRECFVPFWNSAQGMCVLTMGS